MQTICSEHRDKFEAAKSEERAVRELLNAKRREIDYVQSVINRMKNETSIDEIDDRVITSCCFVFLKKCVFIAFF